MKLADLVELNDITDIKKVIKVDDTIKVTGQRKEVATQVATAPVRKPDVKISRSPEATSQPIPKKIEVQAQNKTLNEQLSDARKTLATALSDIEKFVNNNNAYTEYKNDPYYMRRSLEARDKAREDIKRLEPLVAKEFQDEKLAKANAEKIAQATKEYAALSPNEKILTDYEIALSAALTESVKLTYSPGSSREEVNRISDAKKVTTDKINELRTKISTCRTLIETDREINSINNETAVARARLRQT